jgi:hypothetical protein
MTMLLRVKHGSQYMAVFTTIFATVGYGIAALAAHGTWRPPGRLPMTPYYLTPSHVLVW